MAEAKTSPRGVRVLVISPFPVLPPVHGGRVRTLSLARGLARAGARVDILAPWIAGAARLAALEPGLRLHTHRLVGNLLPRLVPKSVAPALALLSLQPRAFGPRRWLARFADCNVIQLEFCAHSGWLPLRPAHTAVVYSAHNVESEYHRADPEPQLFRRPALQRIQRLEQAAVTSADLVVACSDNDAGMMTRIYGAPRALAIIANGFDADLLTFRRAELRSAARAAFGFAPDDRVILFVGGDAAHNRDAVAFLARDVLPVLGPRARLLVVGRSGVALPPAHPRIRQLGFVPDLRSCFAAADVAVNPVDFGSGTNIKLGEYVAAGVPAISTPTGLRGVPHLARVVRSAARAEFVEALRAPWPEPLGNRAALLAAWTWDALGRTLAVRYGALPAVRSKVEPAS